MSTVRAAGVLLGALALAAAPPAVREPPGPCNTIRWTTASEVDNFGFDVLRARAEKGPFHVINAKIIPGAGTTDLPTEYVYVDKAIEPDTAYYYYVESISMRGERRRVTPTLPARGKPPGPDGCGPTPR